MHEAMTAKRERERGYWASDGPTERRRLDKEEEGEKEMTRQGEGGERGKGGRGRERETQTSAIRKQEQQQGELKKFMGLLEFESLCSHQQDFEL